MEGVFVKRIRKQSPLQWVQDGMQGSVDSIMVVLCTGWHSEHDAHI